MFQIRQVVPQQVGHDLDRHDHEQTWRIHWFSESFKFVSACRYVKCHILAIYNSKQLPNDISPALPPGIWNFLTRASDMDNEAVKMCWDMVGELVWNGDKHFDL
jgi:hypothetical protein